METKTEDGLLIRRATLASSWDATRGALDRSLLVTGAGLGARDFDWDELLSPPAPGQDPVMLERNPKGQEENPCFLYLSCDPGGGEEIVSIGILSSARNMEAYAGGEYCGTGRGRAVGGVQESSEREIIFYKKYLKLESSTLSCKIKLLSFGEKQRVFVSKVVVHVRPASANSLPRPPAVGARIDLDRVQTIMESMGSKLSPGAQQLMSMVRFQQQHCLPTAEQLQSVLGNPACTHVIDLQSLPPWGALGRACPASVPVRAAWTPADGTADSKAHPDCSAQPPGGGSLTKLQEGQLVPQSCSLPGSALKKAVTSMFPKKASDSSSMPNSELLPLLQNLCGQVNGLRGGHDTSWPGNMATPSEGVAGVAMSEQPICAYLENILCKNMDAMEKKLMGYLDQRICKLQEHIDNKIALLMDLLHQPSSPPPGKPLRHYDSGERLSNGER